MHARATPPRPAGVPARWGLRRLRELARVVRVPMTVTKDQAQMLATLAAACRPNGARRWDSAGTLAAIAKVKDRSLAEVVMAVIRAAADRDVDSPGVIPTPGSHWQETAAVAPTPPPERVDPGERCTVHSMHIDECRRLWGADDHATAADHARAKPIDTRRAVEAIKAELPRGRPRIAKPDKLERPPRCSEACIRAEGHGGPHLPPVRQAAAVATGSEERSSDG